MDQKNLIAKLKTIKKLTRILLFSISVLVTGCFPKPTTCNNGELRFETPLFALGTIYSSPSSIYNSGNGLAAVLTKITFSSGSQGFGHSDILNAAPFPFGTNQIIRMSNTVLDFDLKQNTHYVEFEYLDMGGTINLGAHGSANLYVGNISAMPASFIINGVTIRKKNVIVLNNPLGVRVGEKGMIILKYNSDIGGMMIGGQELWLDNFCFN